MHGRIPHPPAKARANALTGNREIVLPAETSITVKLLPPDQQYSIYTKNNPNADVQDNAPKAQMGHAEPADSPLLQPAPKKKD